jgi:hypothetical protein
VGRGVCGVRGGVGAERVTKRNRGKNRGESTTPHPSTPTLHRVSSHQHPHAWAPCTNYERGRVQGTRVRPGGGRQGALTNDSKRGVRWPYAHTHLHAWEDDVGCLGSLEGTPQSGLVPHVGSDNVSPGSRGRCCRLALHVPCGDRDVGKCGSEGGNDGHPHMA